MDRRGFLKLFGGATGALVASATMAEAGMLAEFMSWLRRAPAWSFPSRTVVEGVPLFDQISAATLADLRDNIVFDNYFVDSAILRKLRVSGHLNPFSEGLAMRQPLYFEEVS